MPLGYSHSGNIEPGYAPTTTGSGRTRSVSDWSHWDRRFGPLLTGKLFQSRGLGSAPLTDIYLPFHEAWPEDIRAHYQYRPSATAYPDIIVEHALLAGPIESMLTSDYSAAIRRVVRQFAQHVRDAGWRRTRFHFYLNNKYYYRDPNLGGRGTSWWLLDEPMNRDDWLALAYFARLMKEGLVGLPPYGIVFRTDISRPQWQRDYLDGLVHLMVVNDELFRRPALMEHFRLDLGITLWHYGSPPRPSEPLVRCEEWPVRAYLNGADGIVPWQSLGQRLHYQRPEATALILPGRNDRDPPVPTLRLKALERGARTVEYLKLLSAHTGWTRHQVAAATKDYLSAGDYQGLRAAVLRRLDTLIAHGSERSHSRQSLGHPRLGRPRSPKPKP